MKYNTGCNHTSKCPPAPANDTAKVKAVECRNEPLDLPEGTIYVPVVLAKVELQVDVEANIKLPSPASEIKEIRKNVSLDQCKAIPSMAEGSENRVKLFISGSVHKNIQYVDGGGYIKDYSVDVPFHCNQSVLVDVIPNHAASSKAGSNNEFRYIDKKGHGGDRCQFGHFTDEFFNEPIECRLSSSLVHELDLLKHFDVFGKFNKITEKMEIVLYLKLLQNRTIVPNPPKPAHSCKEEKNGGEGGKGKGWKRPHGIQPIRCIK